MVELITEIRKEYPSCADYPVVMASAENGSGVRQVFELAGTAAVQRANENDRRFSPQGLPGGYNKQCRELRTQLATRIEGKRILMNFLENSRWFSLTLGWNSHSVVRKLLSLTEETEYTVYSSTAMNTSMGDYCLSLR